MSRIAFRAAAALGLCLSAGPAFAQSGGASTLGMLHLVSTIVLAIAGAGLGLLLWRRRGDSLRGAVFAAMPTPRQIVDAQGHVVYANPAFYAFFGRVEQSIPELLMQEVGADEEARGLIERLSRGAQNGESGQIEIHVPARAARENASGAARDPFEWLYVAAYPIDGHPGHVYWGVDDATPQRQVEAAVHEQQERFVDLLERAPIGFYSVDQDGNFLFLNRTLMGWLNLPREDLESGKIRLHDVIADDLPADAPRHHPFADPELPYGEVSLKSAQGSNFRAAISQDVVYSDDGQSLRTRSVVRDLSRDRAMAKALELSEERFGRFFQEAPVGIALISESGEVTECNNAFGAQQGEERKNLRGLALWDLVAEADRDSVRRVLVPRQKDSRVGAELSSVEVHLGIEGASVCALYVSPLEDVEGKHTGFIAYLVDTTEQKNLEAQFAQSQKMQAVGQLAGGIAHDFNNLLTAMIGFCDLLLLRHRPGDQSFADIMQIKQNANRAANLVRQLLAFSRQQTLQPRKLDVTDILAELSHLLRRLIGEHIELKMTHGRDIWPVKADQGQLEQVIINLAVNARDAMSPGDSLSIRTENITAAGEKRFKAEVMPEGDYVLIEVVDTGCGIPPGIIDRIFDPFFSTKEVGAGTGLGLSTVYGIIKQSGGFVFVDSKPDQGTTFSVYLPHFTGSESPEEAAEVEAEEAKVSRDLTGMGTLLLVEDEDAVRAFGSRALRNKGYNVLEADSGETALEVLQNGKDHVDLLITDVVMPRMDGPTLVREIRGSRPELKVIFISGYTEDAFRQSLDQDADIHFLPKPFSLKQLAGKVKEVMAQ